MPEPDETGWSLHVNRLLVSSLRDFSFNHDFKVLFLLATYPGPSSRSPRGCRLPTGRRCHSPAQLPARPDDQNWSEDDTLLPHLHHTWSASQGRWRNRFLPWSEHLPVCLPAKHTRSCGGQEEEEQANRTCRRLCWRTAGCCCRGSCSRTCQTPTSPCHILGGGGWDFILRGVSLLYRSVVCTPWLLRWCSPWSGPRGRSGTCGSRGCWCRRTSRSRCPRERRFLLIIECIPLYTTHLYVAFTICFFAMFMCNMQS